MQIERRRSERDRRESWRVSVVCAVRNTVAGRLSLGQAEDIGPDAMDARYFQSRSDNLHVGKLAHVMNARV